MYNKTYRLIEQLKHYNLTYLIPRKLCLLTNDDWSHVESESMENDYYVYNDFDYYEYDNDVENEYDGIPPQDEMDEEYNYSEIKLADDLEELMQMFDSDYMEPSDFLSTNIWELFGLTKNQFGLINWDHVPADNFCDFYDAFMKMPPYMPVEKRVRYSVVDAVTHYHNLTAYHGKKCTADTILRYMEHIIDTHDSDKACALLSLLSDYLRFYDDALEMNGRRARNGQATFKYVMLPKPAHLKDLHDKASRDFAAMEAERACQKEMQFEKAFNDAVHTPEYLSMLYEDKHYIIRPVTCPEDLKKEGQYLNHCVASYAYFVAARRSYIYLIRNVQEPDTPFYTAEILPSESYKNKPVLNQLYTFFDSTEKTKEFREFISRWAKDKRINIKCKV